MILDGKAISFSASKNKPLRGSVDIPGDKSISHRALIIGSLAIGKTKISGLLESFDVMSTANAMRSLGATIHKEDNGEWIVGGVGVGGFVSPEDIIDCGNSGTSVRLIMGATSTCDVTITFTGDSSLRLRPMKRIIEPISEFGATVHGYNNTLPLTLIGAKNPIPVDYISPHPSAQVKSAVLLAGLNAPGETRFIESTLTRDHSERMLKAFGANIKTEKTEKGWITVLRGHSELKAQKLSITRDPSSAAFVVCAAVLVEDSEVVVPNINLNPTRNGLYETLIEMGANLNFENHREENGEPIADIRVRYSSELKGVDVPESRAPSMIDEYPILACVAACALGRTRFFGVGELRVKESDRIASIATGLRKCGVNVVDNEDTMEIYGKGAGSVFGDVLCESNLDHRVAMSFLCLGLASKNKISVDDIRPIDTSFPTFFSLMNKLGAEMRRESF